LLAEIGNVVDSLALVAYNMVVHKLDNRWGRGRVSHPGSAEGASRWGRARWWNSQVPRPRLSSPLESSAHAWRAPMGQASGEGV